MQTKSANKISILIVSIFIMFYLSGCALANTTIPTPSVKHTVKVNDSKLMWAKDNIYVVWNGFSPMLGASLDKVCFLGGLNNTIDNNLICLDEMTGNLLWQTASGIHTAFYVRNDGIYVAYSGITGVRKYNFDGQVIWSQSLLGNGSVYLQSFNNQIHVLATPDTYYLLKTATGEIVQKIEKQNILYYDDHQYIVYLSNLQSYSSADKKLMWDTNLDDVLELAPLVTKDIFLLRTGRVIGTAYAIEREKGEILWKSKSNIISTITYSISNNKAYVFDSDGHLVEVDLNNGHENIIATFENQDFKLNGDALVGGYEVAFDETNQVLFLYLGDSRQLFAFRIN